MFNSIFQKINPEEINENFFRLINHDWMLVTAGNAEKFNTMTASWGSTGILWNKPIAICFIRPQRFTFGFAEQHEYFTLSFFPGENKEMLNFCGTHSGRSVDKIKKTGLKPIESPKGNVTFEQAWLVLECRKLYADFLKEDHFVVKSLINKNYLQKDFHKFFIGEIEGCYRKMKAGL
jgi:flavin reductase (DIM6/NTAB) family NADH-FMN oxidoreductase RutF